MYRICKEILKKLLPKKFLYQYELTWRLPLLFFYGGRKYHCNICGRKFRKFISLPDQDKLCPYCGSISRNRRLWEMLFYEFIKEGINILDFSPSRNLYRKLKKIPFLNYYATDLSGNFIADFQYDITKIDVKSQTFDLIICYHILEHIENDKKAIDELFRVLKNGGVCIIQTPFKEGETYENKAVNSPAERLQNFGQEDHVRIYSVKGLQERLITGGFQTEIKEFSEKKGNYKGFHEKEFVLIASKI